MDLSNLKTHERIILNSIIVGGITMFSVLSVNEPTWNLLYAGIVAGILTCLTQLKTITNNDQRPQLLSLI